MKENIVIDFTDSEGMLELMDSARDSDYHYSGHNEDGEETMSVVTHDGIATITFQKNGYIRKNILHRDMTREELFEGRWRETED